MNDTFRYNKISLDINFAKLEELYEVFKVTTIDEYIDRGSYLLDVPSLNLKAKSIQHCGKSIYILADKSDDIFLRLKDYILTSPDGEKLSIERVSIKYEKNRDYILGNLFLNSLSNGNSQAFKFNNLTGKLYCFSNEKTEKNEKAFIKRQKDQNGKIYISQVIGMQVSIDCNMCLKLEVKTFTNYRLRNLIDFTNNKKKKSWESYPQYTLSKPHNFLKRVMPSEKVPKDDTFILRQIKGEKSSMDFLEVGKLNNFNKSKVGMLHSILSLFDENYSNIVKINFQTVDNYTSLRPPQNDSQNKILDANVNRQVKSIGLRVIDCVKDTNSQLILSELLEKLYQLGLEAELSECLSSDKLNIKLIKKSDSYTTDGDIDPHANYSEYVVQHIITNHENKHKKKKKKKKDEDENEQIAMQNVKSILKELIIKKDLLECKISLVDWSKYGYQGDCTFGIKVKEESNDSEIFYFMKIHPDGSFDFAVKEVELFAEDEYQKYINCFTSNKEVIGIVVNSEGQINCIKDTNLFTVPEFEEIHNVLETLQQNCQLQTQDLLNYIDQFEESPGFKAKNHRKDLEFLRETLSKKESITCDELRPILKSVNKNIEKYIHFKVYDDYHVALFYHLKSEVERDKFLSAETDIKYFKIGEKQCYFVGYTGNGLNKMPKSCHIREVYAFDGGEIFFDEMLALMSVTFVKYGQLTVKPFPFKYLSEYAKQHS